MAAENKDPLDQAFPDRTPVQWHVEQIQTKLRWAYEHAAECRSREGVHPADRQLLAEIEKLAVEAEDHLRRLAQAINVPFSARGRSSG